MAAKTPLERALRILLRLSTHHGVTVQEFYDLFDRQESKRTIQRTLDSIQNASIPLSVRRGPHNTYYYSLRHTFDYIPQPLSSDEILAALLLAPFTEMFAGTRIGEDLKELFEKINHLVPPDSLAFTSALHGLQNTLKVHEPGSVIMEAREQVLRDLLRAILERRVCRVRYASPGSKPKEFTIHPYSLVFHTGAIYAVVKHPHYGNYIYLAVQRIRGFDLTDDEFERDKDFKLSDFLAGNFGVWHEEPIDICIRFDKTVAHTIQERTWHPSQKITVRKNGSVELKLRVGPTEEFIAWVLRWGHYAKIVSPASLREELKARLERTLRNYSR